MGMIIWCISNDTFSYEAIFIKEYSPFKITFNFCQYGNIHFRSHYRVTHKIDKNHHKNKLFSDVGGARHRTKSGKGKILIFSYIFITWLALIVYCNWFPALYFSSICSNRIENDSTNAMYGRQNLLNDFFCSIFLIFLQHRFGLNC